MILSPSSSFTKRLNLIVLSLLIGSSSIGQKKSIAITSKYLEEVPSGMKWTLPVGKPIIIELYPGHASGSECFARVFHPVSPNLGVLMEGDFDRTDEVYGFYFQKLESIPGFVASYRVTLDSVGTSKGKMIKDKITFYPGKKLGVGHCLSGIQLFQSELDEEDLRIIREYQNRWIEGEERKKKEQVALRKKREEEFRNSVLY